MQGKPPKFQPVKQDSPARNTEFWNTAIYKTPFPAEEQGAIPWDAGNKSVPALF